MPDFIVCYFMTAFLLLFSFLFCCFFFFFFNDTATTEIYTLSLHDALPICLQRRRSGSAVEPIDAIDRRQQDHREHCDLVRSEEHTSELQSHLNLVCRLLLEKKKKKIKYNSLEVI